MRSKNIEPERKYAITLFKDIKDPKFRYALQNKCHEDIIIVAPPEVIEIVFAMQSIPPHWANLIFRYRHKSLAAFRSRHKSLTDTQVQQLVDAIATDPYWSYDTIRFQKLLTPDQATQLVNKIATDPPLSYYAILNRLEFLTHAQFQQLINVITLDAGLSYRTILALPESLTADQFQQCVNTIATKAGLSRSAIEKCYKSLTPDQVQQLSAAATKEERKSETPTYTIIIQF